MTILLQRSRGLSHHSRWNNLRKFQCKKTRQTKYYEFLMSTSEHFRLFHLTSSYFQEVRKILRRSLTARQMIHQKPSSVLLYLRLSTILQMASFASSKPWVLVHRCSNLKKMISSDLRLAKSWLNCIALLLGRTRKEGAIKQTTPRNGA